MDEMLPSEVRAQVLEEHERLRERIAAVREALRSGDRETAVTEARTLFDALLKHLDSEDRILVPTLATIDAWGPERARRLAAEHAEQREWVEATREKLSSPSSVEGVLQRLERFLGRLEKDMEVEESETLDPKLFREYPFPGIDMGGA